MNACDDRRRGFTIVEILVVVGVITVLVGLLLPALAGVQRRSRKADEVNRIRQVGIAWNLYAQQNQDAALPGFLDASPPVGDNILDRWRARYNYPNGEQIVPDDYVEEWPWRLLPFLSYDQDTILGHLDLDDTSQLAMSDVGVLDQIPGEGSVPRPQHISERPAFGYNAFYVGGWWDDWIPRQIVLGHNEKMIAEDLIPRPRFAAVNPLDRDGRIIENDRGAPVRVSVVARKPSSIHNPSRFLLFCSSATLEPGRHFEVESQIEGAHFVVPPYLGESTIWRRRVVEGLGGSDLEIEVIGGVGGELQGVPIGRYTGQAAVLYADLHTEAQTPASLDDMQQWISVADREYWVHSETLPPDLSGN